jgi:diguanylate cyclase (GGDEF)-like protein/PAS domain S-box-containing protein
MNCIAEISTKVGPMLTPSLNPARSRSRLVRFYTLMIVAMGALISAFSLFKLQHVQLDWLLLLLAGVTLCTGARIGITIPHLKGHITLSEAFIFLVMLIYGSDAAILLAAAEAACSSLRISKDVRLIAFNAAALACATWLTGTVIRLCYGNVIDLPQNRYAVTLIIGLGLMALVQYFANSTLIAIYSALTRGESLRQTWTKYYLSSFLTYFVGASAAGLIAKLAGGDGIYTFIVISPIILAVYLTYRMYLKNVENSAAQAEQAQRHVEELSSHIIEQERIKAALQESEAHFRSAFDHAAGMALVTPDGRWLKINRSLCEIIGYSEKELLATNFQAITHRDDLNAVLTNINHLLEGKRSTCQLEKRYVHKRGHAVWVLWSASVVRDVSSRSMHLIFQVQNITDRKRAEEQLLHVAFHDPLTGLPNRALFMDRLNVAMARTRRQLDNRCAVLFLDLDRFKIINDSLGHMVGDQLLIAIARRLEGCVRPGDTVARLGGDEFTVLLENLKDESEAINIVERIQGELTLPFNLNGHEVFTNASIGIAYATLTSPLTGKLLRMGDLLRDADTAMYRAKMLGKARYEVFDVEMHERAVNLLQLETDLRRAVDRKEFSLQYQPIIELASGQLRGFEALLRWDHPERGKISPLEFIQVAEENGLIIPIGYWALEAACRQLRHWQEQFPTAPPLSISVNLSCKQFAQPNLTAYIEQILRETNIAPSQLKLEITESMVMGNIKTATEMLNQLRAIGVKVSIDDFGTGYSSLSYLHRLPLDTLKIDRSFVSEMSGTNENTEIVRTIVMLAQNLGMDVIAEGVATEEQVILLKGFGCECAQGYYFSKPMDPDVVHRHLTEIFGYPINIPTTGDLSRALKQSELKLHPAAHC